MCREEAAGLASARQRMPARAACALAPGRGCRSFLPGGFLAPAPVVCQRAPRPPDPTTPNPAPGEPHLPHPAAVKVCTFMTMPSMVAPEESINLVQQAEHVQRVREAFLAQVLSQ